MRAKRRIGMMISAALAMAASGCGQVESMPEAVLYGSVDTGKWSETWPLQLTLPGDTVPASAIGKDTDASLWIRYRPDAPRHVTLVVSCESLFQEERTDTLQIALYGENGRPTGKGSYGLYETHVPIPNPPALKNGLTFRIWPLGDGHGITDAGITFNLDKK